MSQQPDSVVSNVTIESLRTHIDEIDERILLALKERAFLAKQIGTLKQHSKMGFHVPERERSVIERLKGLHTESDFPVEAIGPVFREIMSACLRLESPIVVTYLGPGTTFSYLALRRAFGSSAMALPASSIEDVFDAIEMSRADYALVPLENSYEGSVTTSMQRMLKTEAAIHGEVYLPISHNLAAQTQNLTKITHVYSHPQALSQCRLWLKNQMPGAELVETASTGQACEMVRAQAFAAAICTPQAALEAGLEVVARNIQDCSENETRFLILSKEKKLQSRAMDKTSVVFTVPDVHGSLAAVLKIFAEGNVNLMKLESVPNRQSPWSAHFWVDIQGTQEDPVILSTLNLASKHCSTFRILGSYSKID
jgi:chorismate mutase/prephenate dehydratase